MYIKYCSILLHVYEIAESLIFYEIQWESFRYVVCLYRILDNINTLFNNLLFHNFPPFSKIQLKGLFKLSCFNQNKEGTPQSWNHNLNLIEINSFIV